MKIGLRKNFGFPRKLWAGNHSVGLEACGELIKKGTNRGNDHRKRRHKSNVWASGLDSTAMWEMIWPRYTPKRIHSEIYIDTWNFKMTKKNWGKRKMWERNKYHQTNIFLWDHKDPEYTESSWHETMVGRAGLQPAGNRIYFVQGWCAHGRSQTTPNICRLLAT